MIKPVEKPEFASSVPKTLRVLLDKEEVIEPWAEITLQRKVSGNLSENMEDWLVEKNVLISTSTTACLHQE